MHIIVSIAWIGILYSLFFNFSKYDFSTTSPDDVGKKELILKCIKISKAMGLVASLFGLVYYMKILTHESNASALSVVSIFFVCILINFFVSKWYIYRFSTSSFLLFYVLLINIVASIFLCRAYDAVNVQNSPSYAIGIGGMLGIVIFLQISFMLYPQVIEMFNQDEKGQLQLQRCARRFKAVLQTSCMLSIISIICMVISSHLPIINW